MTPKILYNSLAVICNFIFFRGDTSGPSLVVGDDGMKGEGGRWAPQIYLTWTPNVVMRPVASHTSADLPNDWPA